MMTQWEILLRSYSNCTLYAQDVIELLRCGVVPPPEALPMIADILAGDGLPLKGGRRAKMHQIEGEGFIPLLPYACAEVHWLEVVRQFPRQKAKERVCEAYGISMRALETELRNERERAPKELREAADKAREDYIRRIYAQ